MVASMSRGKKAYLQYERELGEAIARLAQLREEFKAAIEADAEAFTALVKAFKQAKEAAGSDGAVTEATRGAINVPLGVAERAREVEQMVDKLVPITNPKMASDLKVGRALARAAIEGALANVEINLEGFSDEPFASEVRKKALALKG